MEKYLISKKELLQLISKYNKLELLEAGGVDNWPGYSECLRDEEGNTIDPELLAEEELKELVAHSEDACEPTDYCPTCGSKFREE